MGPAGAEPRAPVDEEPPDADAAATGAAPRSGTTICWPSATGAARLTAAISALAVGPPATSSASVTRAPAGSRTTPGERTAPQTYTTTSGAAEGAGSEASAAPAADGDAGDETGASTTACASDGPAWRGSTT